MNDIQNNLESVEQQIEKTAGQFNRDLSEINLIAVSKKQPIQRVREMLDAGHRLFGENRVQEAMERWQDLRPLYDNLKLHLIGPLQSNKAKEAVALFDVIETIDRSKIVKAVAAEVQKQDKEIECFIQINTGEEEQKAGVTPAALPDLLQLCHAEGLKITGLMCIPPQGEPPALHFAFLKKLADQHNLKNLSMGMSGDFEKAIPLGATHVRVGTALFGARD